MEAIILVGIPAAGKTTFYRERFFDTHVRISLDMLRTRGRERALMAACLAAQQPFAVDNTNVLAADRAAYLAAAKKAGFRTTAYYFQTDLRAAIARNGKRGNKKALPVPAVIRSFKRMQVPTKEEGFDALYNVTLNAENQFTVEPWPSGDSSVDNPK